MAGNRIREYLDTINGKNIENATEISIKDLSFTNIREDDKETVDIFFKKTLFASILSFLFFIIFLTGFSYILYAIITNKLIIPSIISSIIYLFFVYLLILDIKNFFQTLKKELKIAKYGIVKSKYLASSTRRKNSDKFLLNIFFADNNTFITRVSCERKLFNRLKEDDKVLIVSTNNKHIYALPVKNKSR